MKKNITNGTITSLHSNIKETELSISITGQNGYAAGLVIYNNNKTAIQNLLKLTNTENVTQLPGQPIRIKTFGESKLGSKVTAIGHITTNKWLYLSDDFSTLHTKEDY